MNIVSVNVGQPLDVVWRDKIVRTSIFKHPVAGSVRVRQLNLDGDAQADLRVHGGVDKAVYVFSSEYYEHWQTRYPQHDMGWGFFGENLTTAGLLDEDVCVGDRFRIGSAEFQVTCPRLPCSRLGWRFQDPEILRAFLANMRTGYYLSVQVEGELRAGLPIQRLSQNGDGLTVPEIVALYSQPTSNPELLARAARDEFLPASWRATFARRLSSS